MTTYIYTWCPREDPITIQSHSSTEQAFQAAGYTVSTSSHRVKNNNTTAEPAIALEPIFLH